MDVKVKTQPTKDNVSQCRSERAELCCVKRSYRVIRFVPRRDAATNTSQGRS